MINTFILAECGTKILVDPEDKPFLERFKWWLNGGYPKTVVFIKRKRIGLSMHRLVSGMKDGMIDHVNRNPLDNRKSNLRRCTHAQNMSNAIRKKKNKYRGVNASPSGKKFQAQIMVNGKKTHLGCFNSEIEAAEAYDMAALRDKGEFAVLNFAESKEKFRRINGPIL